MLANIKSGKSILWANVLAQLQLTQTAACDSAWAAGSIVRCSEMLGGTTMLKAPQLFRPSQIEEEVRIFDAQYARWVTLPVDDPLAGVHIFRNSGDLRACGRDTGRLRRIRTARLLNSARQIVPLEAEERRVCSQR